MQRKCFNRPKGFTWLDVTATVAVIILIIPLLLPALVLVRDLTQRRQCAARLRVLATALHAYHDTHRELPPAAFWVADGVDLEEFLRTDRPIEITHQNWVQLLLPHFDQLDLRERFDPSVPVTNKANADARETLLPQMRCPADPFNGDDNGYRLQSRDGSVSRFARGNYAINGGSQYIYETPGWLSNPRPNGVYYEYDTTERVFQWWGNGVAGINKSFGFDDFVNGLATTVMLEEVRAGIHPTDPRGVWSLGQISSCITWGHGVNGDAYGPNCLVPNSDDIQGGIELIRLFGIETLVREGMPCCDHCRYNNQATARSKHPGGVHVLLADGSLKFIANEVDLGLWHVIHSRETPSVILSEGIEELATKSESSTPDGHVPPPSPGLREQVRPRRHSFANSVGMEFVVILPGEFTMGIPNLQNTSPYPDEAPAHPVRITRAFYLGTTEVTQRVYEQVMGINPSWHTNGGKEETITAGQNTSEHPVENVTWYDASEFCKQLSDLHAERSAGRAYRLPTEAEWEYACRCGKSNAIRFEPEWTEGDESGEIAGKNWKPGPLPTVPVGTYPANDFGLHDMCGNVFEWCEDYFSLDYYNRSPILDPQGPAAGYLRVVRGWYWVFTGPDCVTNVTTVPWRRSPFIGFRVVCELQGEDDVQ